MASPKVHFWPTLILSGVYFFVFCMIPLFTLGNREILITFLIFGFGFLIDIDHLSLRRIKKILRGEKGPVSGWVNWMHTGWALVGVILVCYVLENYLPLVSYAIHILIDAGDRGNLKYRSSPLPEYLHRFFPEWLKYETGLII